MIQGFLTYDLAVALYERCAIALGSNREVQALLSVLKQMELLKEADRLGGMLYRLVHPKKQARTWT